MNIIIKVLNIGILGNWRLSIPKDNKCAAKVGLIY